MHPVHPRRHHPPGQVDVAVMKGDDRCGDQFVQRQMPQFHAKQCHHDQPGGSGKHDLARMKTQSGLDIHGRVRMMHSKETPQEPHGVIDSMPPIHPCIEEHQGGQGFAPLRKH